MKLFGPPSRRRDRTSPAVADVSTVHTPPADQPASGPVCGEPEHRPGWGKASAELSGAVLTNPWKPKWDSNGYRISPKLPSSFPRQEPYRGGTHWSR